MRTTRSFNVWNVTSHSASRKKEIAFMNTISNSNVPQILWSFWKDFRFHYNFIVTSLIFRMMWSRKILFGKLYIPISLPKQSLENNHITCYTRYNILVFSHFITIISERDTSVPEVSKKLGVALKKNEYAKRFFLVPTLKKCKNFV